MEKTLSLVKNEAIKKAIIFAILIGLAIFVPVIVHYQPITGIIVNATLFIATLIFAPGIAILIGLFPSIIALSSGLLPAPLAPMIPFIMIANTILILSFYYLKKKNFWIGVIGSSLLKFLFLFSTSSIVINLLLKKELAKQVALMMNWPQFLTAVGGGIAAYFFLKATKKLKEN